MAQTKSQKSQQIKQDKKSHSGDPGGRHRPWKKTVRGARGAGAPLGKIKFFFVTGRVVCYRREPLGSFQASG